MTLRGQPQELTLPYLHDLAASQLHSWLASQEDGSALQVQALKAPHCLSMLIPSSYQGTVTDHPVPLSLLCAQIKLVAVIMQEASRTEVGIADLRDCSMVAHTALAVVKGRQYAVVRPCSSSCNSMAQASSPSQTFMQAFPSAI